MSVYMDDNIMHRSHLNKNNSIFFLSFAFQGLIFIYISNVDGIFIHYVLYLKYCVCFWSYQFKEIILRILSLKNNKIVHLYKKDLLDDFF